jgi:hypothetical protein
MNTDMFVWIAVIRSEDDEDGVYAFTSREKAKQFVIDTIVQRHTDVGTPSRDIEAIVEQAERDLEYCEEFRDEKFKPLQDYCITCSKVN